MRWRARGRELGHAAEHELDAEQALDDRLVDLAREVHALLQLAGLGLLVGGLAGEGGERGGLAERPQQVTLGVPQRRAVRPAVGEDHAQPAAGGGHRRAHERRLADQGLVLLRDALDHRARELHHAVLDQALARDRHGLDRHLRVGEELERDAEAAGRADAPPCAVVAEDHRAVHVGEPACGLAQAAVEGVAGRVRLDAREQLDERLERVDRDRRLAGHGVTLHPGAERYSSSRRVTPGELDDAADRGRGVLDRERPAVAVGRPARVDQRRQAGRVHERDLGQIELDGVVVTAQPLQHRDQLGRGRDVELAMDHEQAVAAEVGDLRDLPARSTLRARVRDASADAPHRRRRTNQTVVPPFVSTPQRSASRPTRKRPKPPGSSTLPEPRRRREAVPAV